MISIVSHNSRTESQIIFSYDINIFSSTLHCYSILLILFLFRYICASYYIIFFLRSYFLNISNLFLTSRVSPFFCSSNSHQSKIIAQLASRSTNRTLEIPRGGYYQQIAVQFQFGQLSALVLEKLLITIDLHASWCNMAHVLRWRSTSSIGDPVEPIRGWSRVVRLGL